MLYQIMHLTVILFLYGVILVCRTLWYEYCELDNHGDPHPLSYMSTIKNPGMWKILKVEFTIVTNVRKKTLPQTNFFKRGYI